jgi:phospholipid/cholesterol/gamma-HCH transport system substrate-binding protein
VVKFHGVPIGKVVKISYDPKDLLRVKVEIKVQYDFPLKQGMYCETGAMGITGLKYIEVLGGTNDAPLLKPGSVVPSKQSMFTTITGKAEVIIGKIELLLNHLNLITDPDSLKGIKTTIKNVAAITDDFHALITTSRPDIETISKSIRSVALRADSVARDIKFITAEAKKTIASGQMGTIMTSADSTVRSVQKLSEDVSLIVRQSREDIMVSMENLRQALENANELTKILAENPSLLLKGEQQKERDNR